MRPSCSVTERYRTGCHDLGVTHHGCYLSATSYGNRRKEHHRRPQTLRTPHLDTHCLLPTTRSPMPNLPLALKIMRFRVPANTLNQFIAAAVAEKVGCLRTARDFLRDRGGTSRPRDMLNYLRCAPKIPLSAEDQQ
jgi:hypothetical protein